MLSELSNTFFPISSFAVSLFLVCIFFFKENTKNQETKIYAGLIMCGLFESFSYMLLTFLVDFIYKPSLNIQFEIINKVLLCIYVIWMSLILHYIVVIAISNKKRKTINIFEGIVSVIFMIVIMFSKIELYYDPIKNISNSFGPAVDALGVLCILYLTIMLIILIINRKNSNLKGKFLPCYTLIILFTISLIIRYLDPYFNITSNIFSLVLLIMYNTIENPDTKMVEELTKANIKAERANKAKSDFLSSMSHEIRTPLNAIVGFSEDIQNYKDTVDPVVVEDAEYILEASQTLLEIVGNILDINKIEADKMEIVEIPYNFKEEIQCLCNVTSTRIGDKPINLKISIADDIPYELLGDKVRIKQIVNNLLTNSIKYTDEGEIQLSVKCINTNDICTLVIGVKDTGRGIKKENIDKVFTKFERLDIEKNSTTEGTGLGLAITKKLVEMMNGKINVQSNYGKGSIFVVQIPQKISKIVDLNEKKVEIKQEKTISLEGKKVLIVDDNLLNIKVARRALESFNFDLDDCDSGQKCLDKINCGEKYDLILMDIMMPGMSGEEVIKKLKQNNDFKTPVIALTADAIAGAKEKYLSEGFIDYISKPFTKEQINEKLQEIFK